MKYITLKNKRRVAVDNDDFEKVAKYKWYCSSYNKGGCKYAVANIKVGGKTKTTYMHRLIMDAPKGMQVDHINHNGLDNRRSNLRLCTREQNQWNSRGMSNRKYSKYKGVSYDGKYWVSAIVVSGINYHLGRSRTEKEARARYVAKSRELRGEFAEL